MGSSPAGDQPAALIIAGSAVGVIGGSGIARGIESGGLVGLEMNARDRFASWNRIAPIDAYSGDQIRHWLSRAGNRQINRVLHIMATVQLRNTTEGRAHYDREEASGKTSNEAMRALNAAVRHLPAHGRRLDRTYSDGPGRIPGNVNDSSVTGSHSHAGSSEKSLLSTPPEY